jgi:hypothetical protein
MLTLEKLARDLVNALNDEPVVLSERVSQILLKLDEDLTAISKDRQDFAAQIEEARGYDIVDDELEIDDDPLISNGSPDGVWVSAWIWVPLSSEDVNEEPTADD